MNDGYVWLLTAIVVMMFVLLCFAGVALFMVIARSGTHEERVRHEPCDKTECPLCLGHECLWEYSWSVTIDRLPRDCPKFERIGLVALEKFKRMTGDDGAGTG